MPTVTAHEKLSDGSYRLIVADDQAVDHEFVWPPFDPDTPTHQGGPAMSEAEYIETQRAEALALVEAPDVPQPVKNLL